MRVGQRLADVRAELGDLAIGEIARTRASSARVAPSTSSLTRSARSPSDPSSYSVTMPGWLSRAAACASRRTRPASAAGDLLDRHLALEPLVERPVDGAHAPRADPVENPEPPHDELTHHFRSSFAARSPGPSNHAARLRARRVIPGSLRGRGHTLGVERTVSAFNARDRRLTLAFLDEDEQLAPRGGGGRRPAARGRSAAPDHGAPRGRRRRSVVVLLILVVLGIRGCLNARKERSFENYVSDLTRSPPSRTSSRTTSSTASTTRATSAPLSFEAEIKADRGTAESLRAASRPQHSRRVEERPERAQPRLPAAPRRPHRNLRQHLHGARQPGPHPGRQRDRRLHAVLPGQRRPLPAGPARRSTPASRTRESTRRRPTASSCRPHRLARPSQGLIRARPGLGRQGDDQRHPRPGALPDHA